jgi:hypothetical protein
MIQVNKAGRETLTFNSCRCYTTHQDTYICSPNLELMNEDVSVAIGRPASDWKNYTFGTALVVSVLLLTRRRS